MPRTVRQQIVRFVWTVGAGVAAVGALFLLAHCGRPSYPNVILIVLDTLRADRLGAYGNPRRLTPFLDGLAKESLVYDRAYAPSAWTVPSVASLFVARYPSEHQVVLANGLLTDDALTLAEVLSEHGFLSAGFSANLEITAESGFGQGFDTFQLVFRAPKEDAANVNRSAFQWLDTVGGGRPLFLYLQYMEPHSPYRFHDGVTVGPQSGLAIDDASLGELVNQGAFVLAEGDPVPNAWRFEPAEVRRLNELYDGEVAYLDRALAQLFQELERRGTLRHALVIVAADHGEEFGDHELFGHGNTLFEATMHVPLMINLPGDRAGGRMSAPVTLAAVAPTILRQLRISIPSAFRVPSLPLDGVAGDGMAYAELFKDRPSYLRLHQRALVSQTGKLLIGNAGEEIFYDLAADPGETRPLSAPPFAPELRAAMARVTSQLEAGTAGRAVPVDAATQERLRALGYAH